MDRRGFGEEVGGLFHQGLGDWAVEVGLAGGFGVEGGGEKGTRLRSPESEFIRVRHRAADD